MLLSFFLLQFGAFCVNFTLFLVHLGFKLGDFSLFVADFIVECIDRRLIRVDLFIHRFNLRVKGLLVFLFFIQIVLFIAQL